jgi:hypothetical protein
MTIISTTSNLDLREFNSIDVVFDKEMPGIAEEQLLKYDRKWYIGSYQGCSCGFRHIMSENFPDLGFSDPEEWFSEEPEDILATIKLVRIFKKIISTGAKLECIDAWAHDSADAPSLSGSVVVNFQEVSETSFRLIENYHHEFTCQT